MSPPGHLKQLQTKGIACFIVIIIIIIIINIKNNNFIIAIGNTRQAGRVVYKKKLAIGVTWSSGRRPAKVSRNGSDPNCALPSHWQQGKGIQRHNASQSWESGLWEGHLRLGFVLEAGVNRRVLEVIARGWATAMRTAQRWYACGRNSNGQLGIGSFIARGGPCDQREPLGASLTG